MAGQDSAPGGPDPVGAYFAAVNAEDWTAMAGLWDPGAELTATGARPRHGREEILAYYPKVLAGYAEHEDRPGRRITDGRTVVVEVRFTGRTTRGPAGDLRRGRRVRPGGGPYRQALDLVRHRGGEPAGTGWLNKAPPIRRPAYQHKTLPR
jgi:hypothetical protein